MDNYIRNILETAGWYTERKFDIQNMIDELLQEGYVVENPKILEHFKEFWGLNLEFSMPDKTISNIKLNASVVFDVDKDEIDRISEHLHEKLIPVGSIHQDTALLLLSETLKFYMILEGKGYEIGN